MMINAIFPAKGRGQPAAFHQILEDIEESILECSVLGAHRRVTQTKATQTKFGRFQIFPAQDPSHECPLPGTLSHGSDPPMYSLHWPPQEALPGRGLGSSGQHWRGLAGRWITQKHNLEFMAEFDRETLRCRALLLPNPGRERNVGLVSFLD